MLLAASSVSCQTVYQSNLVPAESAVVAALAPIVRVRSLQTTTLPVSSLALWDPSLVSWQPGSGETAGTKMVVVVIVVILCLLLVCLVLFGLGLCSYIPNVFFHQQASFDVNDQLKIIRVKMR